MDEIDKALSSVVEKLSDENYEQSLAFYRVWFGIGQAHHQIPSDQIFNAVWNNRRMGSMESNLSSGRLINSTISLILRFASDAELDHFLGPYSSGLQSRLCAKALQEFFNNNLKGTRCGDPESVYGICTDANLIAHWANLGYVEEAVIRDHILQSLISHSTLYDHQVYALVILFKLAGATFEAYADPSVVGRCFELLKNHRLYDQGRGRCSSAWEELERAKQEVIDLRERGWEGLPPPPVFTTGKLKPTGAIQKDLAATPVATSFGLPNRELEPQMPPREPAAIPGVDTVPTSPVTPATQSPSISIATLSDFTIADASDDEPPPDPSVAGTSDDELPINHTAAVQHKTFYLEDGNVEVLCEGTLFRVTVSTLSFHSPALRRMFAKTNLATAESPNGCPRIISSDTATDFTMLLKMIYLPGFPERNKVPDFPTFSSLLRVTARYEMPAVRSQILEVVRDAYPETFEGLGPSKLLGESVFTGRTPHPNEVLNLFVQQKLTSALPMAYYMAIRRGLGSLMNGNLLRHATLSSDVLQSAMGGLMALREMELNETHYLIFEPKASHPCSALNCPSRTPTGPAALLAHRNVLDRIVGSSQSGTKVLEVPEFYEDRGGELQCIGPGICGGCVGRWESGHAELRKKAWATLPDVFGLNSR